MSRIHVATGNNLTRELVETVVAFITEQRAFLENQANSIAPEDPARFVLNDLISEMRDHLQIDLAVTLATFGIGGPGEDTQ